MKIQLLIFTTGLFNLIPTYGRLIQKNKTINVEETQTEKPNPSIQLTRDTRDSLTGVSKEEPDQSVEYIKFYNRARYFFKANPKAAKAQVQNKRIARNSMENQKVDPKKKQPTAKPKKPNTTKTVLVKKPIPKYHDKDYGDFQSKISNSHIIADSGEHEDEDFNLQDYDFDINHDEFASGRKPLEPRTNIKDADADTKIPETKVSSKVVVPETVITASNKKQRSAELEKHTKSKEFDYYDDLTTKSPEKVTKAEDEDYRDENYDSKELDHTNSSARKVRSLNIDLFGNPYKNMPKIVSHFMGILPLFPQLPNYQSEEHDPESTNFMADPLTGRRFLI